MTAHEYTTGKTTYAKPYDETDGYASPWDDDLIVSVERTFGGVGTGIYDFALESPKMHHIYEQVGAEPAAPDAATPDYYIGKFPADDRPTRYLDASLPLLAIGRTTQHTADLRHFGSIVTGTPSAQLYIDRVATGAAYNLVVDSGTRYRLPITIPNTASLKGKAYEVRVSVVVDGRSVEYVVGGTLAITNATSDISEGVAASVTSSLQGSVVVSEPVIDAGQISSDIVIGDDYLAAKGGRSFVWTVPSVSGVAVGDASCFFGLDGGKKGNAIVEGAVSDVGDGTWQLTFDLPRTSTTGLEPGEYSWSVAVHDTDGTEITRVRNRDDCYRVRLVRKQT